MGCKATICDTTGMQLLGRKRTSFRYKRKQEAKAVLEEGPGATQKLTLEQMSEHRPQRRAHPSGHRTTGDLDRLRGRAEFPCQPSPHHPWQLRHFGESIKTKQKMEHSTLPS